MEVKVPGGRAVGELPGSPGTERSKRAFARSRNSQATFLAIKNYNKNKSEVQVAVANTEGPLACD